MELASERKTFEARIAQQNDRINLDIELRRAELEQTKVRACVGTHVL